MLKLDATNVAKRGENAPQRKVRKEKKIKTERPAKDYKTLINFAERLKPPYLNTTLLFSVLGIVIFGLVMLYNASNYNSRIYYGTPYYFVTSQAIGFFLGLGLMAFMYFFDYRILKKLSLWIYLAGAVLLVLVFMPVIGISKLGSSRWIGVGGFSMQPSELAKFAFIIMAARVAAGGVSGGNAPTFKKFALILGAAGIYCGLIFLEPNLSITLVLGATAFAVLFLFGAKLKHLFFVLLPALVALPVMLIAEPYRVRRLMAFVDPWANPKDEGFQLIQSLFGLGNGGFFGVGFGKSTQKHMFLPFSESDFIFSIIGEEMGFLGATIFILNLLLIVFLIFRVGQRCHDRFGKYLCFGFATVLFIQSAVNLAVVTGTIPPTGVPLPFISFGGTSLAVYMAVIGIVLNIDKANKKAHTTPL